MSEESAKKPTLLLVDDDSIIADCLEYVLIEEYEVNRASDRLSSFEVLSNMDESPTLALIDLGLPPDTHKPDEGLAVIKKYRKCQCEQDWQRQPPHYIDILPARFLPKSTVVDCFDHVPAGQAMRAFGKSRQ